LTEKDTGEKEVNLIYPNIRDFPYQYYHIEKVQWLKYSHEIRNELKKELYEELRNRKIISFIKFMTEDEKEFKKNIIGYSKIIGIENTFWMLREVYWYRKENLPGFKQEEWDKIGKLIKLCAEKIRHQDIKNNLCISCRKNKSLNNSMICNSCKEKNRKNFISRYYQFKESGICVKCGKRKADEKSTNCKICKTKNKEYRKLNKSKNKKNLNFIKNLIQINGEKFEEKILEHSKIVGIENTFKILWNVYWHRKNFHSEFKEEEWKRIGKLVRLFSRLRYYQDINDNICTACRKNKPLKNLQICSQCKEKNKKSSMSRYNKLKKSGMCVNCGKRKTDGKAVACKICNNKHKNLNKKRYMKLKKLGLCHHCGKNKVDGKTIRCKECKDKRNKIRRKKINIGLN